jgi:hypothetical protein
VRRLFPLLLLFAACSDENPEPSGQDAGRPDFSVGGMDATPNADADPPDVPMGMDAGEPDNGVDDDAGVQPDAEPEDTGMTMPPLAMLSDDFAGAALDPAWTIFGDPVVDVTVENGALSMHMVRPALWFNAMTASLVYKEVTGDFKVTARVHARKFSDPAQPPDRNVHLGGLMARDPQGTDMGGQENYVFIVAGYDVNDISVEHKTTTDNNSVYMGPSWPSGDAELRICRIGSAFRLYKRELGATSWTEAVSYMRPDLPATLQVGANAYAQGCMMGCPDLVVSFDELTFAEARTEADCSAN